MIDRRVYTDMGYIHTQHGSEDGTRKETERGPSKKDGGDYAPMDAVEPMNVPQTSVRLADTYLTDCLVTLRSCSW
jgi:hypothetical protein